MKHKEHVELTCNAAIQKGIDFLSENQLSSGGFNSWAASSINSFNEFIESYDFDNKKGWFDLDPFSVFPTILIGQSLCEVNKSVNAERVLQKIDEYVISKMKFPAIWNHFTPEHIMYKMNPFDLDSTAVALSYLQRRRIPIINENATKKLIYSHQNRKKLFYTFLTFRMRWNFSLLYWILCFRELKTPFFTWKFWKVVEADRYDVDGIVNSNIISYLGRNEQTEPVLRWIAEAIQSNQEQQFDKWYKNSMVIYYFVSRIPFLDETEFLELREIIKKRINNSLESNNSIRNSSLDTALAAISLLNLNEDNKRVFPLIEFVLNSQSDTGNWPKQVVYLGGPKKIMGWGSDELTTAFCLEAIAKYKNQ